MPALQNARHGSGTLVAEYEISINSFEEIILKIKAEADAKRSQAPMKFSTQENCFRVQLSSESLSNDSNYLAPRVPPTWVYNSRTHRRLLGRLIFG